MCMINIGLCLQGDRAVPATERAVPHVHEPPRSEVAAGPARALPRHGLLRPRGL